jgi:hypothetical protein
VREANKRDKTIFDCANYLTIYRDTALTYALQNHAH